MASAETPSAALSAGVTVALLLTLKKGTAQTSTNAESLLTSVAVASV